MLELSKKVLQGSVPEEAADLFLSKHQILETMIVYEFMFKFGLLNRISNLKSCFFACN